MRKSQKKLRKLERRRADYSKMLASENPEKYRGYHRPGSNKK